MVLLVVLFGMVDEIRVMDVVDRLVVSGELVGPVILQIMNIIKQFLNTLSTYTKSIVKTIRTIK